MAGALAEGRVELASLVGVGRVGRVVHLVVVKVPEARVVVVEAEVAAERVADLPVAFVEEIARALVVVAACLDLLPPLERELARRRLGLVQSLAPGAPSASATRPAGASSALSATASTSAGASFAGSRARGATR